MDADLETLRLAYTPSIGAGEVHRTPSVKATDDSLDGLGCLVEDAGTFPIEIVRWPQPGWRPIDENTGDQGGTTEGTFELWWRGETLFARNNAVGDSYLFAWSTWPEEAAATLGAARREQALVWRANYHPDGGQLFFPMNGAAFVVPLAPPGDDVTPESFVSFYCDGHRGLYVHPNVWHGPVVPIADTASLFDKQGKVHARVSVDFVKEFGCYLSAPLAEPTG
ncbi:MAG TPA: ureidoglycolate lyase [Acidimicrobiales bacterium]|jgi:hypothetical protein|nr:ureidoglycolate lyase [Acidimicrobiales bacterium]